MGSGTIRRCDLVEVGVALMSRNDFVGICLTLERVLHRGSRL